MFDQGFVGVVQSILEVFTLVGFIGLCGAVLFLIGYFWSGFRKIFWVKEIIHLVGSNAYVIAFGIALSSMVGSLFYSDIAFLTPCLLCWYQRVVMYPQVILYGVTLLLRKGEVVWHGLILSAIGWFLAGYHYYHQMFSSADLGCSTIGMTASCSDAYFVAYGFITIPMMAFVAFGITTLTMIVRIIYLRHER